MEERQSGGKGIFGLDHLTVGIVVGVLGLVVTAVMLALARPAPAQPRDESTPAGVVHNYLLALEQKDPDKAYGYLTAGLQAQTSYEQFANEVSSHTRRGTIMVEDDRIEGDRAWVWVRRTSRSGGWFPFSSLDSSPPRTVLLRLEGGSWRLTERLRGW